MFVERTAAFFLSSVESTMEESSKASHLGDGQSGLLERRAKRKEIDECKILLT